MWTWLTINAYAPAWVQVSKDWTYENDSCVSHSLPPGNTFKSGMKSWYLSFHPGPVIGPAVSDDIDVADRFRFPIVDGIETMPVELPELARRLSPTDGEPVTSPVASGRKSPVLSSITSIRSWRPTPGPPLTIVLRGELGGKRFCCMATADFTVLTKTPLFLIDEYLISG